MAQHDAALPVVGFARMRVVIQSVVYPPSHAHGQWIVIANARNMSDGACISQKSLLVTAAVNLPHHCCGLAREQRANLLAEGGRIVAMYCDQCPTPGNVPFPECRPRN